MYIDSRKHSSDQLNKKYDTGYKIVCSNIGYTEINRNTDENIFQISS